MSRLERDPQVEALVAAYRDGLQDAGMFAENEVTSPARSFLLRVGCEGWSSMSLEQQLAIPGQDRRLVTWLIVTGRLRPTPEYLVASKLRVGQLSARVHREFHGRFMATASERVGFDDRVISLYARGLTVREIQGHLAEIYGTEVSPDLISKITDTVLADAKAWQNRPLERVYPIVYLDALVVKIRDGHTVKNQACYVALGVTIEGERDVLGLWFQQTEGAKFWLHVLTDLKTRGVADILFVCVDGLTGFPEAIEATFPHATVQTCLVHQVRSSMRFVSYKDRKPLAADLRKIYTAVDAEHAGDELQAFAEKWDHRYPMISASWLEHWEQITPFLAYPAEVRRVIYTTNSIEALHRQLRKIIKTRGHFPTEDAARKLIYLAIQKAEAKWKRVFHWPAALAAFKIEFGDRIPDSAL